ncbi:MAG: ATP-grasp domain-containing protein [Firmicutes bacterium]|nr:ATP-grasp domain-containing protein [Bacillota bacterium]
MARNRYYIDWLTREAEARGVALHLVLRDEVFHGVAGGRPVVVHRGDAARASGVRSAAPSGAPTAAPTEVWPAAASATRPDLPDFALMRTIDPVLSEQLERCGVPVWNSSSVARICNDKAVTHEWLAAAGIPMADTWCLTSEQVQTLPSVPAVALDYPLVVKTVRGRSGRQVYRVHDASEWQAIARTLPGVDWVAQRPTGQAGKDVRVFVIGRQIVGAVLRVSTTDFRANYSLGGSAAAFELTAGQRGLVERVIDTLPPLGMVGVDWLLDGEENFLLNEVEDVVGSRTLALTTDVNFPGLYLDHILSELG